MIERDTCYFCTSTFQLLAILALAYERKERSDLYIDPQFSGNEGIAERILDTGLFQNVTIIESKRIYEKYIKAGSGIKNHLQIAKTYFHVTEIARTILLDGVDYKNMFISSKAYLPRMVQLYFIKDKRACKTFYFDDGAGTYDKDRAYRMKTTDRVLRTALFGKQAVQTNYDRYVFSQDLYNQLNEQHAINVRQIRKFWEESQGRECINHVFGIVTKPKIVEKTIILDQPIDELLSSKGITQLNEIYNMTADAVGRTNIVIKEHPRSSTTGCMNIRCMENNSIPFELYCLNMNMDNKILISYSSTAVATPKILFNQEPIVIVLSRLIEPVTGEKDLFLDFFNAVKNTYRDPDRFIIPANMEELRKLFSMLRDLEI